MTRKEKRQPVDFDWTWLDNRLSINLFMNINGNEMSFPIHRLFIKSVKIWKISVRLSTKRTAVCFNKNLCRQACQKFGQFFSTEGQRKDSLKPSPSRGKTVCNLLHWRPEEKLSVTFSFQRKNRLKPSPSRGKTVCNLLPPEEKQSVTFSLQRKNSL